MTERPTPHYPVHFLRLCAADDDPTKELCTPLTWVMQHFPDGKSTVWALAGTPLVDTYIACSEQEATLLTLVSAVVLTSKNTGISPWKTFQSDPISHSAPRLEDGDMLTIPAEVRFQTRPPFWANEAGLGAHFREHFSDSRVDQWFKDIPNSDLPTSFNAAAE